MVAHESTQAKHLEGSRADKRRIVHPCVGADSGDLCAMMTESVAYPERTSHERSAGPHSSRESQEVAPRAVGSHSGMRSIVVLGWVIMTEILVGAASSEVSTSSHSLDKWQLGRLDNMRQINA